MAQGPGSVERTVVDEAAVVRAVRVEQGAAGWWAAAVVAIVAVVGLIFVYANQPNKSDLQVARDQGVAQVALDNATASAQVAAAQASQSAQAAAAGAAAAGQHAADNAQVAADRTAQSAQNVADAAQSAPGAEPSTAQ